MKAAQDGSGYGAYGAARFIGPNIAAKKGAAAIVIRSIGSDKGRWPHTGGTNFAPGVTPIPAAALSVADAEQLERIFKRTDKVTLHLTLTPRSLPDAESGNVVGEVPGTDPKAGTIVVGGHLDSWDLAHRRDRRRRRRRDHHRGGQAAARRPAPAPHDPHRVVRRRGTGRVRRRGLCQGARDREVRDGRRIRFRRRQYLALLGQFPRKRRRRSATGSASRSRRSASCAAAKRRATAPMSGRCSRSARRRSISTRTASAISTGTTRPRTRSTRSTSSRLRQNVAAWTTMLWIVANAPEDWDKTTPKGG